MLVVFWYDRLFRRLIAEVCCIIVLVKLLKSQEVIVHGPTNVALLIVFLILLVITWIAYRLLKRFFPIYETPLIRNLYWGLSAIAIVSLPITRVVQTSIIPTELLRLPFIWFMGQILLLVLSPLFYAVYQLLTLSLSKNIRKQGEGLSRRRFIQNSVAGLLPLTAFGFSSYGVYSGSSNIITQRQELSWSNLPQYLDAFKIIQISDAHIGLFFSLEKLEDVLATVRREKPDLLVITGDLVDDLSLLQPAINKLSELAHEIKYGIYFCWGNHEYFRDIKKIRESLANSPIRVLENSNQMIIDADQPFYLLGVDYPWADSGQEQAGKRLNMFTHSAEGIPQNAFKILLSHHPDFIYNAFEAEIPLTLTGHTHGGQVLSNYFSY
ncbi:metallophosphoesterase [bacterium BFN5]|nr:metallophosphoesterase [bacterium BFN5]